MIMRKSTRFVEKQITLEDESVINYAEGTDNGDALLLIHGQTGNWKDYSKVLPELSKKYHVFAVDCYGHGKSEHDESKYYIRENGDDLIWFIDNVIQKSTTVSGHSSGGLLAAYIAAYENKWVKAVVLEDPPVFSTEPDYFEKSFTYHDTSKVMHEYLLSDRSECWEAYYLRRCLWGQLYMPSGMNGLSKYAQKYYNKHPNKPVHFFFMPESINAIFLGIREYDFNFGEHFFDYSWHSGIKHEDLFNDINVPTIFLHVEENYTEDGILLAASSNAQAEKACSLIDDCKLINLSGNHNIHRFNSKKFLDAVKST